MFLALKAAWRNPMKRIAIAAGALFLTVAASASAQIYYRNYDSYRLDSRYECWNPRAQTYEQIRNGESQPDLDMRNCHQIVGTYVEPRYERRAYIESAREECWNPRARHFESVRPGERQDDLDYTRCRVYR
jgi:hypothetical protein